jgi:hypothetical protein
MKPPRPLQSRGYAVGKGRPPVDTRWRPGQSGNPKGRPKGSKSIKNMLNVELQQSVTVTDNGKSVRITKAELIAKRLVSEAAKGNMKAIFYLVELAPFLDLEDRTSTRDISGMSVEELSDLYRQMIQKTA